VHLDERALHRLLDAARALVSDLDPDAVLRRLLEAAADVTGARYVALGVLDEAREGLERFVTHGIDAETHRKIGELPKGRGILGTLIQDPRPLRLDSVRDDPRSYGFPPHHPPMTTFLGAPVPIRGEPWGNLYLTEKAGGKPFTEADEEAVVMLAELAGVAIENARSYQATHRRRLELERAVRRFEATAAVARALGGETDLERVLELIVDRGLALVEAGGIAILLREPGGLVVAAADGELPPAVREGRVRLDALPARGGALVPLVFRGSSVGLLATFGAPAETEDQQLLQAFAAAAATAVSTARSVEEQRLRDSLRASEEERRRWARELHDETLQGLGGLRLMLVTGRRRDEAGLREVVDEAVTRLEEEIGALRGLIRELRPAALDELGPAAAIEGLAERISERYGVDVDCDVSLGARHDPELETAVYRIVQESLTNAVKHAAARRIDVRVQERDGSVRVEVADDGRGFDPQVRHEGFGLGGMRERVALLHGNFEIASSSAGTRVEAVLPV